MEYILIYIGAALTALWGTAHLFPTKGVVAGFGDISQDNKRIITMEWIVEGVALIFIGVLAATVTYLDPASTAARAVHLLSSTVLLVLALISVFTGFKVNFIPFKLCPFIFSLSAILILIGTFM